MQKDNKITISKKEFADENLRFLMEENLELTGENNYYKDFIDGLKWVINHGYLQVYREDTTLESDEVES